MTIDVRPYLEDFEDIDTAYAVYLADLKESAASGDLLSNLAAQVSNVLTSRIRSLNRVFARGVLPKTLDANWRANACVFVGRANMKFFTVRRGQTAAILIDDDFLCRLVLFLYLVGLDRSEDITAQGLSAFVLLSIVVPRDEKIEFTAGLLLELSRQNGRLLSDLFLAAGKFILFHELGHTYTDHGQRLNHLRLSFGLPPGFDSSSDSVESIKFHADGIIYGRVGVPGTSNGLLVIDTKFSHWKDEFGADIFALYADLLSSSEGTPSQNDLDRLASYLACWQLMLFAIGTRERYMRAISGETESERSSHPTALARFDVLVHHLDHIAIEFFPEWRSEELTLLYQQYGSLWAEDMGQLVQECIEYVRYGFDEEGSCLNQGQVFTFTGGQVPYVPSAMAKLHKNLLEPLLIRSAELGWDAAVRERQGENSAYLETFRLSDEPIILKLGKRLHEVNVRFISEDRI